MVTKITYLIILFGSTLLTENTFSQPTQYQTTKPGVIIVDNQLGACPEVDVAAVTRNLSSVVDWLRANNQAMNPPTGFDAAISLSGNLCDGVKRNEAYGIQTSIYLSFRHFYIENGVSKTATAIQYMSMQFRTATPAELGEFKERNNGLSDFAAMFYNSLPVQKIGNLITK